MYYLDVFRALSAAGVRYLVAGGVALNLHGVPRMTADLDLAIALDDANLAAALEALAALGLAPSLPVSPEGLRDPEVRRAWAEEKHLVAFPFHDPVRPYVSVDLLVHLPVGFDALWEGRDTVDVAGAVVPMLGIDDLIALKRAAGRDQDLADVRALERVKGLRGGRGRES